MTIQDPIRAVGRQATGPSRTNASASPDYKLHVSATRTDPRTNRAGVLYVSAHLPEEFEISVSSDYDTPFAEGVLRDRERLKLGARLLGVGTTTQIMSLQVWQGSAPIDLNIPIHFLLDSDPETDILRPIRDLMSLSLPSTFGLLNGATPVEVSGGALTGLGDVMRSPGPKVRALQNVETQSATDRILLDEALGPGVAEAAQELLRAGAEGIGIGGIFDVDTGRDRSSADIARDGFNQARNLDVSSLVELYDNISIQIGSYMYFPSVVVTNVSMSNQIRLDRRSRKPIQANVTLGFRTVVTPKAEDMAAIIPS